ncbi:MAG TPA: 4-(cytidine 5'-diphospho)-2-C-methyl-D-erythritol kinase [Ignavibacteriaceae bacterium]|nr:4-(cytidine 5'-diphospho)-2-C-methyl-D-erythritol kinase [Ignavibacteriaceae bacterium]
MEEIKVKAPAKINLGLNVISKRADGYHNIETIFYPIELSDLLTFKNSDKFIFTSSNEELNKSKDNLVIKAKELIEEEVKQKINIHIHLEKNIPIGGGLGGGSSDAAIILTTLNKIFNLELSKEQLLTLALKIGSDVPFFINPQPCFGESRGEILQPINLKINFPLLIVNPGIHISTKEAYSNILPRIPEFDLNSLTQEYLDAPEMLAKILKNDFESFVLKEYAEIKNLKDQLYELGASFVLMSGSGSTLWSIFKDKQLAKEVKIILSKKYFTFLQNS